VRGELTALRQSIADLAKLMEKPGKPRGNRKQRAAKRNEVD
jgi:hypothetical protein